MVYLHNSSNANCDIVHLKFVFTRYWIPQILISYDGSLYHFGNFGNFACTYGFRHITGSPYYPRKNAEAETGVQTRKRLLKSNYDVYAALLTYRSTPLQRGFIPAELSMGRNLEKVCLFHSTWTKSLTMKFNLNLTPKCKMLNVFCT